MGKIPLGGQARNPRSSSPTATMGHVGGYVAPVDTAGMDPEMKEMMADRSPNANRPGQSFGATLKNMFAPITNMLHGKKNSTGNDRSPSTVSDRGKR